MAYFHVWHGWFICEDEAINRATPIPLHLLWHDLFTTCYSMRDICVSRPIHICAMTHAHVWHDSCTCVTWLLWHDSFICVTYLWHDSSICVTWFIHMCDVTHSHVWYDSFICVTWLIHMSKHGKAINQTTPTSLYLFQESKESLQLRVAYIWIPPFRTCAAVCVCVCVSERDGGRERERERGGAGPTDGKQKVRVFATLLTVSLSCPP